MTDIDDRRNDAAPPDITADGPAAHAREIERIVSERLTDRPVLSWDRPDHVLAEVLRPGDHLVIRDLEQYEGTPIVPRGSAEVFDGPSFVTLVRRLGDPDRTTLWAQQPATGGLIPSITAVFDDHTGPDGDRAAGWREHRAALVVRRDPDWMAWAKVDKQPMDQIRLAEFLTDQLHTVVEPRAAELVTAITTFSTRRNVTFAQVVNLDSGEQEFTYVDKHGETAGNAVLPNRLTVSLRPFYGAPETHLQVWLRYRLTDKQLTFTLERIRPDRAEEAAWADVCGVIAADLEGYPLLQGPPPEPLR